MCTHVLSASEPSRPELATTDAADFLLSSYTVTSDTWIAEELIAEN